MTDAMEVATKAFDLASKTSTRLEVHEAVANERYKNIDDRLAQLPDISRSIGALKGSVNKAVGGVFVLSVLSTVIVVLRYIGGQ